MAKILVSGCLLGFPCRYDGKSCPVAEIRELAKQHTLIPVCPEQQGGLPTPRLPSEIIGEKVINREGTDVSEQYHRGAEIALQTAKLNDIHLAVLKAKSPSCGKGKVYDGTFSGTLIPGNGVTVSLLEAEGIAVFSEQELTELRTFLDKGEGIL